MRKLVFFIMFSFSGLVHAEGGTCPPGFYPVNSPGVMGCAPIPNNDRTSAQTAPAAPRWKTTWGAFATDGPSAALGASVGMPNKRKAEKFALAQCREKGGKNCEIDMTFYNQCAVLVTGDRVYNTSHAATVEEASRLGIAECEREDVNCRVYYSDCSLPVRIN